MSKLKEDLEKEKKLNSELQDKVTNLDDNKIKLLGVNSELKLSAKDKEDELKKKIATLKDELIEDKKQIKAWQPQVQLSINKLNYLLPMCKV